MEGRLEQIRGAGAEWAALAERSGNVFATPEWTASWLRHMGREEELRAWLWRDAHDAARAVLPLCRTRRDGMRLMRLVGHRESDELGPVCAPDDREPAAGALGEALRRDEGWDTFEGAAMRGDVPPPPGTHVVSALPSPVISLKEESWDEFLGSRSRNFRQQVRARERRLARAGRLSFRVASDPARLERDMDALLALHEARWGGGSRSFRGPREALHRDFAATALERGWLRLRFLELDGRALAAMYDLRYGRAESYYQAGRDPAYDRLAPGFVLMAHAIREALDEGLGEFRLLRGGEPYKSRFATHDPGVVTVRATRAAPGSGPRSPAPAGSTAARADPR